ncbi:hypothetical protein [Thermophagus xiamenensis]|uniref:Uncharacterized protein n=1 Tax=Thermophagus xiamenensis TaxID=385682 RepID=A0A1I2AEI6_9BACT|nr:hypothetical protein [Thermophagus xiamenensis]SFE41968.1 hypothetical protein SAMN05444380_11134 [Thermophagus xiamenensis]
MKRAWRLLQQKDMYKKRQKCTGRRQKKALKKKAEVHRQKAEEGIKEKGRSAQAEGRRRHYH